LEVILDGGKKSLNLSKMILNEICSVSGEIEEHKMARIPRARAANNTRYSSFESFINIDKSNIESLASQYR